MTEPTPAVRLSAEGCEADFSHIGAEPLAWRVGGRDLLWGGDPAFWAFRAPILFPTVGASRDAEVTVDGRIYPMGQHGFAWRAPFGLVSQTGSRATFVLHEGPETLASYPFPFRLEVEASVSAATLSLAFGVANTGERPMPYGIGFHPAFLWPFMGGSREGYRVAFAEPERADLPVVGKGGLLTRPATRHVPLEGRNLPLSSDLFSEALVFLNARSRSFGLVAPTGEEVRMELEGFPHLAVWSKPDAPFLSLEAWSAHADWEDAHEDLLHRDSMIILPPGETGRHRATLTFRSPA